MLEWCSYDDITCMCIEIGLHKFYKSNFDPKNRYIDVNPNYKVDIKEWVEVDNDDQNVKKRIRRLKKEKRHRPQGSQRFVSAQPFILHDQSSGK